MATYKYKLLDKPDSSCYVAFNSTPDIASGVAAGESIRIDAEYYQTYDITDWIGIYVWDGDQVVYSSGFLYVNRIPKSTKKTISFTFTMPDLASSNGTARAKKYTFCICGWMLNHDSMMLYGINPRAAEVNFLKYRLAPKILELDFERSTATGTRADDGQYLRCMSLKIAKATQAAVTDITKATIVCAGSDGSSRSATLTQAQLTTALTAAGYTESKATLFNFASALGVNYTLTLTLGDAYDQVTKSEAVKRSFARLHLSGAESGGVAVGMFSSATKNAPRFEVADNHKSFFYGGVENFGATAALCTASQQKLGIVHGTLSITVNANTNKEVTISFPVTFSSVPNVIVGLQGYPGDNAVARYGVHARPKKDITTTEFIMRAYNDSSQTLTITPHWVAIGPVSASAAISGESRIIAEVEGGPCADPLAARMDYIAMMSGIEIPADAGAAQADPGVTEGPGLDGPKRSAKFDTVKLYYDTETWSAQMVNAAVGKWITAEEAKQILSEQRECE